VAAGIHFKRWATGLAALPFLVLVIVRGGIPFRLVILLVSLLALWEYFRIAAVTRSAFSPPALATYLASLLLVWLLGEKAWEPALLVLVCHLMAAAFLSVFAFGSDTGVLDRVFRQVLAVLYIPGLLSCLILLRDGDGGARWVFFLLCVVFAGDISALYAGTALGRRKLCPAVSPGKTVEGAAASLAANLIVGAAFKALFLPGVSWTGALAFSVSAGIAGQVGDLFESELKRVAGIKDSGGMLPGHGGLLDRIDALLFAAPVAYIFKAHILSL